MTSAFRDGTAARKSRRLFGILGLAFLMTGCAHSKMNFVSLQTAPTTDAARVATVQSGTPSQVVLDEELVSDFRRRADRYMKVHEKAQKLGIRQQQRDDVGENLVSQNALAMRIRFARHDARPGDLFTPPIAMTLRRALDPVLRGDAALRARQSIREDAPGTFVLVVNGSFPEGPRSTMPGNVLKILPPLPDSLEYRIIDTHLVLIDTSADIVVDYVLDVMCRTC